MFDQPWECYFNFSGAPWIFAMPKEINTFCSITFYEKTVPEWFTNVFAQGARGLGKVTNLICNYSPHPSSWVTDFFNQKFGYSCSPYFDIKNDSISCEHDTSNMFLVMGAACDDYTRNHIPWPVIWKNVAIFGGVIFLACCIRCCFLPMLKGCRRPKIGDDTRLLYAYEEKSNRDNMLRPELKPESLEDIAVQSEPKPVKHNTL